MTTSRFASSLFSALALALALAAPAAAQESVKLQPAMIEERVEPGQVFHSSIRATNLTSETKTYYILTRDISGVLENGQPVFADEGETLDTGLSAWVAPAVNSVVLAPGEEKEIPFSVQVPQDAFPGSHFGGIFLSLEPLRPESSGSGIGYQIGTILSLRITGTAVEEARIREFRVDKSVYAEPSVRFSVRVENLGNVLVRARGPIEITNMFGTEVGSLVVNGDAAAVFPKANRTFEAEWRSEGLAFGRYQATVSLVYGEEGRKTVSAAVSFWVLPWRTILPVFGGIVLGIALLFGLLKWYIRRRVSELSGGAVRREPARAGALPFGRLLFFTMATMVFCLLLLALLFLLFS